ncbi:cobalamin B12-binding domain-containing protein [Rhodococcus fascians]|nr:cobalamin B12-binding domain-containing protein [Rhodococcus fascians]MBY4418702.1 cobalamin B12-binding domain-containing protein [Rhodococcus fascians]
MLETRRSSTLERPAKKSVILATIQSDSHMWNLVFLELFLTEAGHTVVNLGPCTPVELIAETAARVDASAVVISSVNGHGHLDAPAVAKRIREDDRCSGVTLVVGGKLGVSGDANIEHASGLIEAGFNAVFEATASPSLQQNALLEMLGTNQGQRVIMASSSKIEEGV